MTIQITVNGIMIFVLCAVAITAVILLIPTLLDFKKIAKQIRFQLEENQQPIEDSIKRISMTTQNMEQISATVKEAADYIHTKTTPGITPYVHIIEEVLQIVSYNVSSGNWKFPTKSNKKRR